MYLYLWVENLHILLKILTFWDYFQDILMKIGSGKIVHKNFKLALLISKTVLHMPQIP